MSKPKRKVYVTERGMCVRSADLYTGDVMDDGYMVIGISKYLGDIRIHAILPGKQTNNPSVLLHSYQDRTYLLTPRKGP